MNQTESDCNAETLRLFVKHLSLSQYVFPKSKRVQPFIEDQLKAMKALMEMMEQQETKTKAFTLGAIEDDKGLDRKLEMDDVFPCLICTLGSGAFYCTVSRVYMYLLRGEFTHVYASEQNHVQFAVSFV